MKPTLGSKKPEPQLTLTASMASVEAQRTWYKLQLSAHTMSSLGMDFRTRFTVWPEREDETTAKPAVGDGLFVRMFRSDAGGLKTFYQPTCCSSTAPLPERVIETAPSSPSKAHRRGAAGGNAVNFTLSASAQQLCGGDRSRPLQLELWEKRGGERRQHGKCELTVQELVQAGVVAQSQSRLHEHGTLR